MSEIGQILQLNRVNARTGKVEPVPAIERVNAILEHPESRAIVRQLDPQALHALIHECGIEDSADLVLMASPAQIQALIDFSVWTRDEPSQERIKDWLELVLQMDDSDLRRTLDALDPELLPLWLRGQIGVLFWEHDQELIDALEAPLISSPDGMYALVVPDEENAGPIIRLLLERVYALDVRLGLRLLESVRWELSAQMQEMAFQARQARLADQGFVPFAEALEALAWLDPVSWRRRILERARSTDTPPVTFTSGSLPVLETHLQHLEAERLSGSSTRFIEAVGALGEAFDPDQVERVADAVLSQFRSLVNRVHIASGSDPGDLGAARQSLQSAERRLSLALDILADGDALLGARILGTTPTMLLHRLGHSSVLQVARQAQAIHRRGNLALLDRPFSLLAEEDRDCLAGLLSRDPRMSDTFSTPFSNASDLEQVARRIARVAAQEVMLFEHARWSRELIAGRFSASGGTPIELLTLDALVATTLLEGDFSGGPSALTEDQIRTLLGRHASAEDLQASLLDASDEWLNGLGVSEAPLRPVLVNWMSGIVARLGDALPAAAPALVDREVLVQVFATAGV